MVLGILICIGTVHFALAMYALASLAYCKFDVNKYIAMNLYIMILVIVGPISFLILYQKDIREGKKKFKDDD
ncbi:MAG: hypothetical protein LBU60_00840 [Clostridiales bacterium]|jgi:hypothetical protein|nr:hypothetical protein [Clostridiales bacterium]